MNNQDRVVPMPPPTRRNISYRDYTLGLSAGVAQEVNVHGDYFQVIKATGKITLEFDQGVKIHRYQGMGGPVSYSRVRVTSDVDDSDVQLALGNTDGRAPYDGRATFQGSTVNVTERVPNTATPQADVAVANAAQAALHAAVSATRMGTWVTVPLYDNTGALLAGGAGLYVRVGDSTVAANKGSILFPGDTRYFPGTHRLYAYNALGAAVDLAVLEDHYA